MADYYADGTATGGGDAGTADNPWEGEAGLQTLLDTLTPGDTGYIRNTFTLTGALDLDGTTGTSVSAVKVIGTRTDSWTVDGTLARIDANGAAANCLVWGVGMQYWNFANVVFENATASGIKSAGTVTAYATFTNCHFSDNTLHGFDCDVAANMGNLVFVSCAFNDNGGQGLYGRANMFLIGCEAIGNAGVGITIASGAVIYCLAHNNGANGGIYLTGTCAAVGCVSDGNTADGILTTVGACVFGCRLTNNGAWGMDPLAVGSAFHNFFGSGNGSGTIDSASYIETEIKGAETNLTTGAEWYEDQTNDKFNLKMGAAGFRTSVAIDADNDAVFSVGLPNVPIVRPKG